MGIGLQGGSTKLNVILAARLLGHGEWDCAGGRVIIGD